MEIQALYAGTGVMRAPGCSDRAIDDYLIQSAHAHAGRIGQCLGRQERAA